MLQLPLGGTAITHADWLELWALMSEDRNASAGDLSRALQREAPEAQEPEKSDLKAQEAMLEINARSVAGGPAYPFAVNGNLITRVADPFARDYLPYTFMLTLSYFGFELRRGDPARPRHWFEVICGQASRFFLAGDTALMSQPRTILPEAFDDAIGALCALLGEGGGWRKQPVGWRRRGVGLAPQDDAVDVVAWRDFRDRQPGKLILFGQCASGDNWDKKLRELDPTTFTGMWMSDAVRSQIIRAFFIPHRVAKEQWNYRVMQAGLLFDRCRIAAHLVSADPLDEEANLRVWTKQQIAERTPRPAAA